MGKAKKKNIADSVRGKKGRDSGAKKVNPFEVKVNRQKHDVIGKKLAKYDKGMPGVSRSKAIQKRKATLLQEYKTKNKANKLLDKRFGENDPDMDPEEKMLKRFALEKRKTHEKSSLFSLNEEEDLTHYGQSLAEIEKFEDPTDSGTDDEDGGKIAAKMVAEEHFGGFLTKKQDPTDEKGKPKSWKERMEEIIAQSKKEKYERQHEKEKAQEMTDQLDAQWKELRNLVGGKKGPKEDEMPVKADDFDIAVRELKFEMKGKATDRLKTEEELAKEEKERLEKLEADRLRRMKGLSEGEDGATGQQTHRSADDLDDGLNFEKSDKNVKFEVQYKDGKLVSQGMDGSDDDDNESGNDDDDDSDDNGSDDSSEDSEDGDNDKDNDDNEDDDSEGEEVGKSKSVKFALKEDKKKARKSKNNSGDSDNSENKNSDSDDESNRDAMERTSDLESDEDEESEQEIELPKSLEKKIAKSILKKKPVDPATLKDFVETLKEKKEMMEAAREELPYTFPAPKSYDDLLNLLEGHSNSDQMTIISRLRKCHHPSLAEGNRGKLETLFGLLVEYYGDLAKQDPPEVHLMSKLVKHLYELCQLSPLVAGYTMSNVIKIKQEEFMDYASERNGRHIYPTLDLLMFFKLIAMLFPTSDFKHPVVTPTMLFMGQILSHCPIITRRDIASGLFMSTVVLEYVSLSKRFVPEVINFLCGVMFLAIKKIPGKIEPVVAPFKPVSKNINFLQIQKPDACHSVDVKPVKLSNVFAKSRSSHLATDEFRVGCIYQCLHLVKCFATLYKALPSFPEIFKPVSYFARKLPHKCFPEKLKTLHSEVTELIASSSDSRSSLVMEKKKPIALKLYEPVFDEVFDGRKKRSANRGDKAENARLQHKYKKELKSAKREIRKDTQFIAKEKLEEQLKKDSERKRKVKEIMAQLADQEGDFKKMKREKDKL